MEASERHTVQSWAEHSRILLSETLEDVLLDLQTDRLRGLLPELAVSARDTFPQLDRGKLADLAARQLRTKATQEFQNSGPSQGAVPPQFRFS